MDLALLAACQAIAKLRRRKKFTSFCSHHLISPSTIHLTLKPTLSEFRHFFSNFLSIVHFTSMSLLQQTRKKRKLLLQVYGYRINFSWVNPSDRRPALCFYNFDHPRNPPEGAHRAHTPNVTRLVPCKLISRPPVPGTKPFNNYGAEIENPC